jgi:hypothetical protein
VALSAHGLKASARLAVNASPEPFTNWGLSLSEDALVVTLLWLVVAHPFGALVVALGLVVLAALAAAWIVGAMKRLLRRPSAA